MYEIIFGAASANYVLDNLESAVRRDDGESRFDSGKTLIGSH